MFNHSVGNGTIETLKHDEDSLHVVKSLAMTALLSSIAFMFVLAVTG